jgi:hypothetical protein
MNEEFTVKLPLSVLENWDKNPRSITSDEFERLKHRLRSMEQMRPLLVTPNLDPEMPGYVVLGGNMRLRALKELAKEDERFNEAYCTVVHFLAENEGVWRAGIAGQRSSKTFLTREDGMMEYSLLDNERSGYYNADELANIMPEFSIDWDYNIDLKQATSLDKMVDLFAPADTEVEMPSETLGLGGEQQTAQPTGSQAPQTVQCPECSSLFDPRKHPYFGDETSNTTDTNILS